MTRGSEDLRRRAGWYRPHSIWRSLVLRPRVVAAGSVGIAAMLLLPDSLPLAAREALAWSVGGAAYVLMAFRIMYQCSLDKIRTRAAQQDDSAVVILVLVLLAMFSSLAAIIGLISAAKSASSEGRLLFAGLAALTIVISWIVMQVAFTMHYAHEYYAPDSPSAGDNGKPLKFPGGAAPDYWDFFYYATSFGAASQTSDVMIASRSIRRISTLHAIVAFFFNTTVLALAINLAASLI